MDYESEAAPAANPFVVHHQPVKASATVSRHAPQPGRGACPAAELRAGGRLDTVLTKKCWIEFPPQNMRNQRSTARCRRPLEQYDNIMSER